jgi:hypothetical protein
MKSAARKLKRLDAKRKKEMNPYRRGAFEISLSRAITYSSSKADHTD